MNILEILGNIASKKLGAVIVIAIAIYQIPAADQLTTIVKIVALTILGVGYIIMQGKVDSKKVEAGLPVSEPEKPETPKE